LERRRQDGKRRNQREEYGEVGWEEAAARPHKILSTPLVPKTDKGEKRASIPVSNPVGMSILGERQQEEGEQKMEGGLTTGGNNRLHEKVAG